MSIDIADQVAAGVGASEFGFVIQFDEFTDVTNCCKRLIYVRFTQNDMVKTELLLSHEVPTATIGKDIFNVLDKIFTKTDLDCGRLV